MPARYSPIQGGRLALITLGHFWIDSYANFLPALLPLVILNLDLSLTLAGLLATIFSLASSLMQTVMGFLSDRMKTRHFVIIGPLFTALFICGIGWASGYATLLVLLFLGGLGIAAFHPQTVTMAGEISGSRRGFGVSLFVAGGTAGYALSPLWITALVSAYSLEVLPLTALPGLAVIVLMLWRVPLNNESYSHRQSVSLRDAFHGRLRPVSMLMATVIVRSITRLGMMAFLPIMLNMKGFSLVIGGTALTIFSFLGAAGGLVGGMLSDRLGRRRIIFLSMLGSAPLLYAALQMDGLLFFVLLGLGGWMLFLADSVVVAAAQEMVPERAAMASSLVMGFGWGVGGLTIVGVGGLSDAVGVATALAGLALLPLLGLGFCLGIPDARPEDTADSPEAVAPETDRAARKNPACTAPRSRPGASPVKPSTKA